MRWGTDSEGYLGGGGLGSGVPLEQTAGGGARPQRRRSGGRGWWGNGRRAARGLGEAICGLRPGEGWPERGPPRRGRASAAAMAHGELAREQRLDLGFLGKRSGEIGFGLDGRLKRRRN